MCVFTYTYIQNTTICQIVSLSNKQQYIIYNNYMFRPCKRTVIRLFTEPSSRLHNRSLGGGRDLFLYNSYYVCNVLLYRIILTLQVYVSYELYTDMRSAIVSTYNSLMITRLQGRNMQLLYITQCCLLHSDTI